MKKSWLVIIILFASISSILAETPKFPVIEIPEALKKDVDVVVREDKTTFTILSSSHAKSYTYFVITIFNAKGADFAKEDIGYDKLTKITSLNANVYDAFGKGIKKLKKSEIYDQSYYSGSLFSDDRFKAFDLSQGTYPYTVEIEYELEYDYLYSIPSSYFIPGEKASVQHAYYQLVFPSELAPKYKTFNLDIEPSKATTANGMTSLTWELHDLAPIKMEAFAPEHSFIPQIHAAPNEFEYAGYKGSMASWEEYGKWHALLNKDRDILTEQTKATLRTLTKDLPDNESKTKAVYEYLQGKTRYVSIQLGIGGLQPFEASVVEQMGYGDCKALSNFMVAMLKEVGIKAYYTTVMAGANARDVMLDFPSHQANHVIVAVPNDKDTVWLECTSQKNPFGYMGGFTGNRKALMITDNGGVIVNTPRYDASTNIQSRTANVVVERTGDAKASVKTTYTGMKYESGGLHFLFDNPDEQNKWVQENTEIPIFDINAFSITQRKSKLPSAIVDLNLSLRKFANVTGKRIFLVPNLMNRVNYLPEKIENRKTKVVRKNSYTEIDTIAYHLPEDVYPEFVPEPTSIKSVFGTYEVAYKLEQGALLYVRKLVTNKGTFPAESYTELADFYKKITKADNTKIVFLSKT
jgi:transglutaminase-like putative cysteine protease